MIKAEIVPSPTGVIVKHIAKYARSKSMAAVMLGNVTLGSKAIGNLTGEYADGITWEGIELPEAIKSKFRTARYVDDAFIDSRSKNKITRAKAVVILGESVYYMP